MSESRPSASAESHASEHEPCSCPPLFPAGSDAPAQENWSIPIAPPLRTLLRTTLARHFPRLTPLSLLLLHITQFEHLPLPPTAPIVHKRLRYHAPASLLEQVIQTVRRTLRADDLILTDEQGSGAALLFPEVDREGMSRIAGRVSASIHLLQAETVTPPLRYETEIALGFGSYPQPAGSLDALLACAGRVREPITFRPAILAQAAPSIPPARAVRTAPPGTASPANAQAGGIPFMQLPSRLPTRLKQLIPHALALDLRCAPVGRDHNRLTVAMANPTDARAISYLRETTGLTIFPVACEPSALETLLASGW
jgi:hypothetical protein